MALTDYSDLEREISETPDIRTLPNGTEAKLRIIAVRTGISDKNDCRWYQPVYDVPSEPLAAEFNDFIWDLLDSKKLDPKQKARNMNRFKNFAAAFGIDYSKPFDWETDLIGKQGWAILGVRKSDEYGDQNTVRKYITGAGKKSAVEEDDIPF